MSSMFDFVDSVGKQIEGGKEPDAAALKKELDSHNLGTEGVKVEVEGDKAVVKGEVADKSIFEKTILAVGNTLGISKVETSDLNVANPGDDKDARFYTVKSGDTLWAVAEAMYGKGGGPKYTQIFEANKPMLTSPDLIYPGQVLRIPDAG